MASSWGTRRVDVWHATADAYDHGFGKRPDDLLCHCEQPIAMPVTVFGSALGGLQECQRCGRPIAGSEATNPYGPTPLLLALTNGQRLVVAVVLLVAVLYFVVWPTVHPRVRASDADKARSRARLMRELRKHDRGST